MLGRWNMVKTSLVHGEGGGCGYQPMGAVPVNENDLVLAVLLAGLPVRDFS